MNNTLSEMLLVKANLESEMKSLKDLILYGNAKSKNLRESLFEANKMEYEEICVLLREHCNHEMIEDYIEYKNGMKKIVYCNNCGL